MELHSSPENKSDLIVAQALSQHLRRDVTHLTRISFYQSSEFLVLDSTTLRNLEILEPLRRDAPRNTSLYGALNRTVLKIDPVAQGLFN